MTRVHLFLLCGLLLCTTVTNHCFAQPDYIQGKLIIKLKDNVKPEDLFSLGLLNSQCSVLDVKPVFSKQSFDKGSSLSWYWFLDKNLSEQKDTKGPLKNLFVLEVSPVSDVRQMAKVYSLNPSVEYAEPDYKIKVQMLPDVHYGDAWGLNRIGAAEAWKISRGAGVIAGVIDSGLDYYHEDIKNNVWLNTDEVPGNGIDDDDNGFIDDVRGWNFIEGNNEPVDIFGHGTHVSGIIAAESGNGIGIVGVAPEAKIMAIKSLDDQGVGSSLSCAQGIIYAVDNGARVINNSWVRAGASKIIEEAVNYASLKGVIVVASAGNEAKDTAGFSPASCENAITVSASNQKDRFCEFSNFGQTVDLSAPAGSLSLAPEGKYFSLSGTSIASPFVSGAAALILSKHPEFEPAEVRNVLRLSADDIEENGWEPKTGFGRLNVYKAVRE